MAPSCPGCGQQVPEISAKCPVCGKEIGSDFVSVVPPRARDRDLGERLDIIHGDLKRIPGVGWLFSREEISLRIPNPELWLSMLFPGLGHVFLGSWLIGFTAAFGGVALFWLLTVLFREAGGNLTMQLFIFGTFLGAIHSHAVHLGDKRRGGLKSGMSRRGIFIVIILGVYVQFTLAGYFLNRYFYPILSQVEILGYEFWAPVFRTGDVLQYNHLSLPVTGRGDFVLFDRNFIERVLGTAGDVLELRGGKLFRNGASVMLPEYLPLVPFENRMIPDGAWRLGDPDQDQKIVVGDHQFGFLYWGRELRVATVSLLLGRIEEIVRPRERRCRFENGKPVKEQGGTGGT